MTRDELKRRLRATGSFRPEHELRLDTAIDDTIQIVWDFYDWSWKIDMGTFTSDGSATKELKSDVDSILELTYGDNNREVLPLPSHRLTELYDNVARTGDEIYYFRLYSTTPEQVTLELVPPPSSGDIFKYRYRRKLAEGSLSVIPSKLHPIVRIGSAIFLTTGDPYSSQSFMSALSHAVDRDKPIVHRRWTMGRDSLTVSRINRRNSIMSGGMGQDTSRPTN